MQYAVGMQFTVGVSAKRSTNTVDLVNMGDGNCYLECKKVKPHTVGDAVQSRCWSKKYTVLVDLFASTPTAYHILTAWV